MAPSVSISPMAPPRCFSSNTAANHDELPGRGLEPLRIAPPDPKSGASANFATLAVLLYLALSSLAQIGAQRRTAERLCPRKRWSTRQIYILTIHGATLSDFLAQCSF